MRQTTPPEVRLDHGKAAGSGITRGAIRRFGCEQRRSQSNFVAASLAETENRAQRTGKSVGVDGPRRHRTCQNEVEPYLL